VMLTTGIACLQCGSLEDAMAHFTRARRLGPNEPWQKFVLTALAQISMTKGASRNRPHTARLN
jgi:hypothetical protein